MLVCPAHGRMGQVTWQRMEVHAAVTHLLASAFLPSCSLPPSRVMRRSIVSRPVALVVAPEPEMVSCAGFVTHPSRGVHLSGSEVRSAGSSKAERRQS